VRGVPALDALLRGVPVRGVSLRDEAAGGSFVDGSAPRGSVERVARDRADFVAGRRLARPSTGVAPAPLRDVSLRGVTMRGAAFAAALPAGVLPAGVPVRLVSGGVVGKMGKSWSVSWELE